MEKNAWILSDIKMKKNVENEYECDIIFVNELGTVAKGLKKKTGLTGNQREIWNHQDYI